MIIEQKEEGLPFGSYDITFYTIARNGRVFRQSDGDRDAPLPYVENAARSLSTNEVLVAMCRSQPGGCTAYGSEHARQAWRQSHE